MPDRLRIESGKIINREEVSAHVQTETPFERVARVCFPYFVFAGAMIICGLAIYIAAEVILSTSMAPGMESKQTWATGLISSLAGAAAGFIFGRITTS